MVPARFRDGKTSAFRMDKNPQKFAGPCAQGVLDPVMIPCPMSQGCDGLFWLKNLLIWAFLGTSAHESVPLVGYLLATRWIIAVGRGSKK